ncbi:hypothetical protein JZ751_029649, partial [Albula glossodonta]
SLFGDHWRECPEYLASNECYFNKTYTAVWTTYCIELRSRVHNLTYDDDCFSVEYIVHPDPPIKLNWTLLNVSRSLLHFDIMVHWKSPPSADVKGGWMTLVYEVNYRERNATRWHTLGEESETYRSIYGLNTGTEYEVRVRCKMRNFENFGEFSETILVYYPSTANKEFPFPVTLALVFGAVGVGVLLVLIIFSQQQKLMVILLPPVPAPKIKGIDPDLLKKGKLDELSSILTSQHLYKPELLEEDTWVEFIEVDAGDAGAKADLGEESDTQRLLGPAHHSLLGLKDDDSGRASCYDPELPESELLSDTEPLHKRGVAPPSTPTSAAVAGVSPAVAPAAPLIQTQLGTQTWVNMDFYAQVSDVTATGAVVLSPGQQGGAPEQEQQREKEEEEKENKKKEEEEKVRKGEEQKEEEEEREKKKQKESFQLLVVDPDGGAYTSESDARQIGTRFSYTPGPPQPPTLGVPVGGYQSPYLLVDAPPCPPLPLPLPPVSDYTVVQDVDAQHSLLLNPTPPEPPAPHLPSVKPLPAM